MSLIPVTYCCFNRGTEHLFYEETDEPVPSKEVWTICPDCLEHSPAPVISSGASTARVTSSRAPEKMHPGNAGPGCIGYFMR